MTLTDWTGTIGVTMLLLAFFLNLNNMIRKESYVYLILNVLGAGISCVASVLLSYWPFIVLEAVWTLVSLLGLFSFMRNKA
jgi:hypothetical protein